MFSLQNVSKSVVFFTDATDKESSCFVEAMTREEFQVKVYPRNAADQGSDLFQNADLILIESSKFSLEELSKFRLVRRKFKGVLVILAENIDEMLQVMLYEQGIDALLIKPVNPLLMLAQIRAIFRCNGNQRKAANLFFNGLEINGRERYASYHGDEIPLSSREFDILLYMAQNACNTLDRDRLYKNVFGVEYNGYDRSIDMYISRLRSKLAEGTNLPPMIKTVRGKGYLFAAEESPGLYP
jgi:two-component system response regulator RstA